MSSQLTPQGIGATPRMGITALAVEETLVIDLKLNGLRPTLERIEAEFEALGVGERTVVNLGVLFNAGSQEESLPFGQGATRHFRRFRFVTVGTTMTIERLS